MTIYPFIETTSFMSNSLLLTYLFPSQPSPLQASLNNASADGYLNVVVSARGQTIYAQQINIYLPIGSGEAGYLSSNTPIATSNTTRWTVGTAQLVKPVDLPHILASSPNVAQVQYMQFSCFPQTTADQLLNYDLQFSFQITGVDSMPGSYDVGIVETASRTPTPPPQPASSPFTLFKVAPTFVLNNFTASATSGNINVPFGGVPRNTPFRLSWQSNGTQFKVYTTQNSAPIYTGPNTQCPVPAGITANTTFIVQAEIVGGPQSGSTSPGFESIFLYDSLTVVCTNADLVTNSINNATTITSTGNISTQAALSASTATVGSLQVSGTTTLATTTISALTVPSSANIAGINATSISSTSLNGGTVNAGNLTVTGPLVAQNSTVQTLATPQSILQGSATSNKTFVAPTDGFVVGYCANPSDYNKLCVYWMFIVVAPVSAPSTSYQVGAQGGNNYAGAYSFGTYVSQPATLTLPVRKGDKVTCYITAFNNNSISTTVSFTFFGQGVGAPLTSAFLPSSEAVTLANQPQ